MLDAGMKTINMMLLALLLPVGVWAEQPSDGFRTNDLASLDLANVGDFWKDDQAHIREDRSAANFQREKSYAGGLRFVGKSKRVEVAVFKTEGDAIKAMEALRADVASVIEPGDTNRFGGLKWWFTSGIPNGVFVVCRNTVVTVACYQPPYAESKSMLQATAATIDDRINKTTKASNIERVSTSP
jgi:hypothetical protein